VGGKIFDGELPGCDSNGLRSDRARAGDVMCGVSDDKDAMGREVDSGVIMSALQGEGSEGIPVVVIICEGPERKVMPDAESGEFGLSASLEVAGEQTKGDAWFLGAAFQNLGHAGEDAASGGFEVDEKISQICLVEVKELRLLQWDSVFAEDLPRDAGIGSTGNLNAVHVILNAKCFRNALAQGAFSRASRQ
jgi:hypothetical protein